MIRVFKIPEADGRQEVVEYPDAHKVDTEGQWAWIQGEVDGQLRVFDIYSAHAVERISPEYQPEKVRSLNTRIPAPTSDQLH
jgi:hypothetical protein